MTQDQCLDNSHRADKFSTIDQVSDELSDSKNIDVSNGVNSIQEFNVDFNDQQNQNSTDDVIVRNCTISAGSPQAVNVSATHSVSPIVSEISRNKEDKSASNIDEINKGCSDSVTFPAMTVIKHQNSNENIREILTTSEKSNKIYNETHVEVDKNENVNSDKYPISGKCLSHSGALKKKLYTNRSENKDKSGNDQSEDPIERLNKLRASISNALSEVKDVLKQYSTDQDPEKESESAPSVQLPNDGPVRFRFVRKIRRRSTFNDDEFRGNSENIQKEQRETEIEPKESSQIVQSQNVQTLENIEITSDNHDIEKEESKLIQNEFTKREEPSESFESKSVFNLTANGISDQQLNLTNANIVNKINDDLTNDREISSSTVLKKQNPKTKRTSDKERRASISIVDKDRKDKPLLNNLKNQRRPSDSMIIEKRPVRVNTEVKEKSSATLSSKLKGNNTTTNVHSPLSRALKKTDNLVGIQIETSVSGIPYKDDDENNSNFDLNCSTLSKIEVPKNDQATILKQVENTILKGNKLSKSSSSLLNLIQTPGSNTATTSIENLVSESNISKVIKCVPNLKVQNSPSLNNDPKNKLHIIEDKIDNSNKKIIIVPDSCEAKIDVTSTNISSNEQKQKNTEPVKGEEGAENTAFKKTVDDILPQENSNDTTVILNTSSIIPITPPKKKRKAKRKVVIRRLKRKLSKDDTFIQLQELPSEIEICEKEIEEISPVEELDEIQEIVPEQRKSCLKARQFEIGDTVMYAERYKKTQVKWRKGIVKDRITSISYKLDIEGDEVAAHISYIKKYTDRKVNFGGKEYLEIDYAQIEEDEEKEKNYSIWNMV